MQSKLFRSKMVLHDDTLQTVSECLGITRQTLAEKLQGTSEFKQKEIDRLKESANKENSINKQ